MITVDGTDLTGPQAALVLLRVDIGLGAAHDRTRLALGWQSPVADVSAGAEVEVAIGFDSPERVLTGFVDRVSHRPWGLVADVLAAPSKLSTTRLGRSYVDLSAGDIVRDLLAEADVDEGSIGCGPNLAAYHVDERRSAWHHIQHLAARTGSEVSTDADGALNFSAAPGAESGGLGALAGAAAAAGSLLGPGGGRRYGAELHDFAFGPAADLGANPTVLAHGAGSELGSDAWHIMLREPEGGPPDGVTIVPSLLRDREGADQLAGAITAAAERATTVGWIEITGDPTLRAADTVEAVDLPHAGSTPLRIRRVTHRVSRWSGFVTHLDVEGAAA
jgi:phage protein D